jgi:D-beta-D-heptose 7-phosphate kinase / D-beta-D-heptose 1-phosphate adenosyltransferase
LSDPFAVSGDIAEKLFQNTVAAMEGANVVAIEDYNKGCLPTDLIRRIFAAARQRNLPVIVDPAAVSDYSRYAGASAIKLNRSEAARATGLSLEEAGPRRSRRQSTHCQTRSGSRRFSRSTSRALSWPRARASSRWLTTRPRQVFDVTGAGDMVLAMVAAARAAGADWADVRRTGQHRRRPGSRALRRRPHQAG